MKKLLLFLACAAGLSAQCTLKFALSSSTSSTVYDNRTTGCSSWTLAYTMTSGTTVSVETASKLQGPWSAVSGFPISSPLSGSTLVSTSASYIRVSRTGSGLVSGSLSSAALPSNVVTKNPDGTVSISRTVLNADGTVTGPIGQAQDAAARMQGLAPSYAAMAAINGYPSTGLVARYDLTGLGAVSSVPNLVSGGPALTLVNSPTIAATGITFATNQYGVTASTLSTVDMTSQWTVIVFGTYGGSNGGAPISLGSAGDNTKYNYVNYGATAGSTVQLYANTRKDSTNLQTASYVSVPNTGPLGVAMMARWGKVSVSRLDTGVSQSVTNAAPTGEPRFAIGCDIRSAPFNCVSAFTANYALVYSRALSDTELQKAYTWVSAYLALKSVTVPPPTRLPALLTVPSNGLAPVPPMGWSTWNLYFQSISDAAIRAQADALVSSGLSAKGYNFVGVDDGWSAGRDASGTLLADSTKFPSGMKALADYVHGKGLKFGLYAGPGVSTCGGNAGSYGYETQDANLFASWGVDYLKYDWCGAHLNGYGEAYAAWGDSAFQAAYQKMALAIRATGRPMLLNVAVGSGTPYVWASAAGGNFWRYLTDVHDWTQINSTFDAQANMAQYAGPTKGWNDLDMLVCGIAPVTDDECKTNISLWSILASPLMASNDLATMSAASLASLSNTDVIAVDQDPLGVQGVKVSSVACGSATCEVWVKQLTGTNTCAIGLFNRASTAQDITATFATIAGTVAGCGSGPYTTTRDLWAHSSLGTLTTSYTATAVPAHGVFMFKVAP